jgi:uncharacterized membrane protein
MRIKTNLVALTFMLVLSAGTTSASIINDKPPKERTKELTDEQKARLGALKNRLAEIKAMDRSTLSKAERKDLRQELKAMNKEAKAISNGVYLSVGAIIIIILLLILLL